MQYSLRTFLIFMVLIEVVLTGGVWAYRVFHYGIDDGDAQWGAAEMAMEYMEDNCVGSVQRPIYASGDQIPSTVSTQPLDA